MKPPFVPPKRDFIGKPAPPGYVAGIGRGATGFTTRSDIGPAREAAALALAAAASSSGGSHQLAKRQNDEDKEDEYLNDSNYDEFAGYGGSLFNKDPYEDDDEEADRIYEEIDKHLDERGKALREAKNRQELERFRQENPKIQQQFSDLKPELKQLTEEDWMSIPDVGDARNRKQRVARQDKYTPVPDSLLAHQAKLAGGGEKLVYIDPKTVDRMEEDEPVEGTSKSTSSAMMVAGSSDEPTVNIGEMSEFRSSYMSMKLSGNLNPAAINRITVNPKDYLSNLQSITQITDESTIRFYRNMFSSLRATNPTLPDAWIASVRLEEAASKLKEARKLIIKACEKCSESEDIWCEAAHLFPPDKAKVIMKNALEKIPKSEKLWSMMADLQSDDETKRKVYAKAREMVPKSVLLWKKSVELEQPEEARLLLREAVQCCPEAVELWLALARLEPYQDARSVLIKASEKNPTARSIWIMAAKLEEVAGNKLIVESIIKHSIERMVENGIEIKRDEWIKEAVDAEKADFKVTCHEIIKRIIGWNIGDSTDKLKLWLQDVDKFVAGKSIECARAVFETIVADKDYCRKESIWLAYSEFERQHGTPESLERVLARAVSNDNCVKSEVLWLMMATERWQHLDETRQILSDALDAIPDSERIIIAAVDLECENKNSKEARRILADACMSAKTAQLVEKAAKLEWSLGNLDEAQRMLKAGVEEYKNHAPFYLMQGRIEDQRGHYEMAKEHYSSGLKFNPESVELWISMAQIEEKTGFLAKARSTLERARLRNPKKPLLWLEAARLEVRVHAKRKGSGVASLATTILAKGIKECKCCPDVDMLHAEIAQTSKRKFI